MHHRHIDTIVLREEMRDGASEPPKTKCPNKITWKPSQTNGCYVSPKQPLYYVEDLNCHIGTIICCWLFGFPGALYDKGTAKGQTS